VLTIDDLLVRAEISDVLQRYVRGIDRVDLEQVAACYHPGAWDDHNQFRGSATDFVAWLDGRLGRHAATTHFLSEPHVRLTEADVAQVDTYCVVHQMSPPDPSGRPTVSVEGLRYLDRFERRDGEWRIAHRKVAVDWRYSSLLDEGSGQPFADDWRIGRRDRSDASYADVEPVGARAQ
jgi:hypothetical protein